MEKIVVNCQTGDVSVVQISPEEVTQMQSNPVTVHIPQSVTMRQARLALLQIGKLADVTTAINSLPSPQKEAAQIEWEYSNEVQRGNNFVAMLGPALGLSSQQLDDLFVLASTL